MSNDRSYLASLQDYYSRYHALPSYASIEEAQSAFERSGQSFKAGDGYIKLLGARHAVHYEFRDGALSLVTLMLNKG